MLPNLGQEKASDKEILVTCISLDVDDNVTEEKKEVDKPCVLEINNDKNTGKGAARNVVVTSKHVLDLLRVKVLFRLMLDRFLEMVVVVQVLLVAINWMPLRKLIENNFWPHELIALTFLVTWQISIRIPSLKRLPGFYLPKLLYLGLLTSVFLLMGIHFPLLYGIKILSPYFAVLASGTVGAAYLFLSILIITKTVNVKSSYIWLFGMVIPMYVLVASQAVYSIAFYDIPYSTFMLNVGVGLLVAVYFLLAQVYYNKKFVNSNQLKDIAQGVGLFVKPKTRSNASPSKVDSNKVGVVETV